MMQYIIEMNESALLHKLNVISKNIGILSWISDTYEQNAGDYKITSWIISRKRFFIISTSIECISITVVSSKNEAKVTIIGGGIGNGTHLMQDFAKEMKTEKII